MVASGSQIKDYHAIAGSEPDGDWYAVMQDGNEATPANATIAVPGNELYKAAYKAATEITVASGVLTVTQNSHKVQPQSGTADDVDTISGMKADTTLALFISDSGTDTLTYKHGTGNISCFGGSDISHLTGLLWLYYDGTTVYVSGGGGAAAGGAGLLANSSFSVSQNGTAFTAATDFPNNDDTYLFDRVINLSDGNDVVDVSQVAVTSDETPFAMQFLVATANKKFGYLMPIETKDSPQIGQAVSVSIRAKTTAAAIRNIRFAPVFWTGTADSITSDIVSAWAVEGTNPTLAASWSFVSTPADNALTTSWQTFTVENVTVPAGTTNVGLFVWADDTDAAGGDILQVQWSKLEVGATASSFIPLSIEQDYSLCYRHALLITPASAYGGLSDGFSGAASSTTAADVTVNFPVPMRVIPSFSYQAVIGSYRVNRNSISVETCTAMVINSNQSTTRVGMVGITVAAGLTQGDNLVLQANNDVTATIRWSAEL